MSSMFTGLSHAHHSGHISGPVASAFWQRATPGEVATRQPDPDVMLSLAATQLLEQVDSWCCETAIRGLAQTIAEEAAARAKAQVARTLAAAGFESTIQSNDNYLVEC